MIYDRTWMERVKVINEMLINKAAIAFLPGKTPLATEPAVLTLIRWGLDNGINPVPVAPGYPDSDRMDAQVDAMTRWEPRRAVMFLTNPESQDPLDAVLTAEQLAAQETPEDAAELLIENLYHAMVANAP